MKLLALLVVATALVNSCSEDDDPIGTFDGSCLWNGTFVSGESSQTFEMCITYNNVLDDRKDDAKQECEQTPSDSSSVTWTNEWRDDKKCDSADSTSECKFKNFLGETASIFMYNASFNETLKGICDQEEDATFTETVTPTLSSASLTLEVLGNVFQCWEFSEMNDVTKTALKGQWDATEGATWTDDGSCATTGTVATCIGASKDDVGYDYDTYYYGSPDPGANEQSTCETDGGTWATE